MVRREIKNFELVTDLGSYPCHVPCSVNSVFSEAGINAESVGDRVDFCTDIYVDAAAMAMKNIHLRLRGLRTPCEILIGDRQVGTVDGTTPVYNIDVHDFLEKGDNRLIIRFTKEISGALSFVGLPLAPEILRFSNAIIDRVFLTQKHEDGAVNLGIKLGLIGNSDTVRAVATLVSSAGQIYYGGLTKGKGSITVRDPLFWWPRGYGVQNLYRLTVNLYGESDVEDTVEMRIGFRTVVTSRAADGSSLLVNGVNFLPMGATYYADNSGDFAAADRKVQAYVTSAAMANYNCLVIPAAAPRPSETFYEYCDIHGILVIEEITDLSEGGLQALERNIHHPSLGLVDIIGSGDIEGVTSQLEERLPDLDFSVFDRAQDYVSCPSLPSMKTIRAIIPEDERTLFSYSIEKMTDSGDIQKMLTAVSARYPYPTDLEKFAYASAMAAACEVGDSVRLARMSNGKEGRAVFDRLGDNKVVTSPSAMDSRVRWKPLQYYCARHFAPIALYAEATGGQVRFSASNLRKLDLMGSVEYRLADASNYTIYKNSEPVEIASMTARGLFTRDLTEYIEGHEREYYLEYYIKEGSSVISFGTLLFVPEKHFRFKKPRIKAEVSGSDRRFSITLSADAFVKGLELDFDGVDAVFSDNYIDLTTDAPVKLSFTVTGGIETAYHLNEALIIRSVYDLTH